jgi:SAM-dependent methyltransferase
LLNYLFHVALGDFMSTSMASNYRYWQQSGGDWGSEYDRRKTRHPFFHLQEMMITDHVIHHAPARVLEFGCGTGRHLRNLVQIPGIEAWGFDQSETMLNAGFKWASKDWRAAQLAVGGPTDPLPYEDDTFDVVFSCEALLHTRPEDFQGRLREMARVCRGHILHIESPPSWTGYSPSCSGCWGHDFVAAYSAIGYQCEILAPGFRHQAPYLVKLDPQSVHWTWHPAMLSLYRQLDLSVERGFTQAASPAIA